MPQSTAKLAPWNRFERDALDSKIRRRVYSARRSQVVLCEIRSSEFPTAHIHPVDQVTIVLRGTVEALVDGRRIDLSEGRTVTIPAGTPHAIRACDPDGAETLTVFPAGETLQARKSDGPSSLR